MIYILMKYQHLFQRRPNQDADLSWFFLPFSSVNTAFLCSSLPYFKMHWITREASLLNTTSWILPSTSSINFPTSSFRFSFSIFFCLTCSHNFLASVNWKWNEKSLQEIWSSFESWTYRKPSLRLALPFSFPWSLISVFYELRLYLQAQNGLDRDHLDLIIIESYLNLLLMPFA